ncbi:MAG: hypothetical protein ACI8X5_001838 [Planctomycetota bacterium]|jgi:hypothetical protein
MAQNSIDRKIQERIEVFASELGALIKGAALASVTEALGGYTTAKTSTKTPAAVAASGTKERKKAGRKAKAGKRFRRTAANLEEDKAAFEAYVLNNPGQRLEEISAGMKTSSKDLKRPVTLLLEAGTIHKEGQRRGTMYYPGGGSKKRKTAKG